MMMLMLNQVQPERRIYSSLLYQYKKLIFDNKVLVFSHYGRIALIFKLEDKIVKLVQWIIVNIYM